jgi:hypothetical protein
MDSEKRMRDILSEIELFKNVLYWSEEKCHRTMGLTRKDYLECLLDSMRREVRCL